MISNTPLLHQQNVTKTPLLGTNITKYASEKQNQAQKRQKQNIRTVYKIWEQWQTLPNKDSHMLLDRKRFVYSDSVWQPFNLSGYPAVSMNTHLLLVIEILLFLVPLWKQIFDAISFFSVFVWNAYFCDISLFNANKSFMHCYALLCYVTFS